MKMILARYFFIFWIYLFLDGNGISQSMSRLPKHDRVVIGNIAVTVVKGEIARQKVRISKQI
jgi:hypothetical protein